MDEVGSISLLSSSEPSSQHQHVQPRKTLQAPSFREGFYEGFIMEIYLIKSVGYID